jgi:(2R)-sulfolactate sulfo-lyase subunit alpha
MRYKFLVHAPGDSVGVAVEPISAGEAVDGLVLEGNSTVRVQAADNIPLGHKIALAPLPQGATVVKYGEGIGRTSAAIATGQHVHVHNLKSARW